LLDESALRALSAKTKVTEIQDQLKGFADCWKHSPLTISFYNDIANSRLDLRIAQYELHSMDDFQTKLLQFPSGTKFEIQLTPPSASQADAPIVSEIQKLVSTHGMVITRVKPFDVN
jgi:hypothetical protein